MSVVESFATTTCGFISSLSREVGSGDEIDFISIVGSKFKIRMDACSYDQLSSEIPASMLDAANHYYRDGNKVCWSYPGCSFKEACTRVISNPKIVHNDRYNPSTDREVDKRTSEDMLFASMHFQFRKDESNPIYELVYRPLLNEKRTFYQGNEAVTRLMLEIKSRSVWGNMLEDLINVKHSDADKDLANFIATYNYYSIGCSTNPHDATVAAMKSYSLDSDDTQDSMSYTALGELANVCEYTINMSRPNGRLGRTAARMKTRLNRIEKEKEEVLADGYRQAITEDSENLRRRAYLTATSTVSKESLAYHNASVPNLRIISVGETVMVLCSGSKDVYCLDLEHIKCLRYISVTHSLYLYYGASVKMEYMAVRHVPVPEEEIIDPAIRAAAGQFQAMYVRLIESLGIANSVKKFDVMKLDVIQDKLWSLFRYYKKICRVMLDSDLVDYTGRFLTDVFSVYTSYLAGKMGTKLIDGQLDEFRQDWKKRGLTGATRLCDEFLDIVKALPVGAAQDFGRLNKICTTYDVNPAQAFMVRVNKMKECNDRGVATITKNYETTLRPMTDQEYIRSMDEYKCSVRVLLAVSESRSVMTAKLSRDQEEETASLGYDDLIKYFERANMSISMSTRMLDRDHPHCTVPVDVEERAYEEARLFFRSGKMPVEPFAGAFIDVSNTVPYRTIGENDISMVKASSIPPSNYRLAMSSVRARQRNTPCRDTECMKDPRSGNMITDYLLDKYPSRSKSIEFLSEKYPVLTTSIKVETAKYPGKDRLITAACGEARRMQSEYEVNVGRACRNVPGFSIGIEPADIKDKMTAAIAQNVPAGMKRALMSADLSGWSPGMHWDMQHATNEVLKEAFDGGEDMFNVVEKCTKNALMIMSAHGIHLPSRNTRGSNMEGLDGKRNTLMHCAMFYKARCDAHKAGIAGSMKASIFIDDSAASIDVPEDRYEENMYIVVSCIYAMYILYGFKLSIMKTVISDIYVIFLNEVYYDGAHIGYGFRALAHTGAQDFSPALNVREELAVITSGIRGAATAGGHSIRLQSGMCFLIYLYIRGMIGGLGRSLDCKDMHITALTLLTPTIAGGYGLPNFTEQFSNLAGHRDVEKLDKISKIIAVLNLADPIKAACYREYVKASLMAPGRFDSDKVADRISVKHSTITMLGTRDRDTKIAESARKMCKNAAASVLIDAYLTPSVATTSNSFGKVFSRAAALVRVPLPQVIVDKALNADPEKSLNSLIKKVVSSRLVSKMLDAKTLRTLRRKYYSDSKNRMAGFVSVLA